MPPPVCVSISMASVIHAMPWVWAETASPGDSMIDKVCMTVPEMS